MLSKPRRSKKQRKIEGTDLMKTFNRNTLGSNCQLSPSSNKMMFNSMQLNVMNSFGQSSSGVNQKKLFHNTFSTK